MCSAWTINSQCWLNLCILGTPLFSLACTTCSYLEEEVLHWFLSPHTNIQCCKWRHHFFFLYGQKYVLLFLHGSLVLNVAHRHCEWNIYHGKKKHSLWHIFMTMILMLTFTNALYLHYNDIIETYFWKLCFRLLKAWKAFFFFFFSFIFLFRVIAIKPCNWYLSS